VDDGNAIVEFVVLVALLMVPLVYFTLAVFRVQGSAYGVTEAAREAARAFVGAESTAAGYRRACTAAEIALQDQAPNFSCARNLKISSLSADHAPFLQPGQTVRVRVDLVVALPFLPAEVFGRQEGISLHSVHDEVIDSFRRAR
jgi:Flp pilus assembly protein TadG